MIYAWIYYAYGRGKFDFKEKLEAAKNDDWKRRFIAGNLLPDTKKKERKVTSHFWNPDTLEDMAIAPDLSRFFRQI